MHRSVLDTRQYAGMTQKEGMHTTTSSIIHLEPKVDKTMLHYSPFFNALKFHEMLKTGNSTENLATMKRVNTVICQTQATPSPAHDTSLCVNSHNSTIEYGA